VIKKGAEAQQHTFFESACCVIPVSNFPPISVSKQIQLAIIYTEYKLTNLTIFDLLLVLQN